MPPHTPPTQVLAQQSPLLEHVCPFALHDGAAHAPLVHTPVQQSAAPLHAWPLCLHVAAELPQTPAPVHEPLQQSPGPLQEPPTSAQVLPSSPPPRSCVDVAPVHAPISAAIEPNVAAHTRAFLMASSRSRGVIATRVPRPLAAARGRSPAISSGCARGWTRRPGSTRAGGRARSHEARLDRYRRTRAIKRSPRAVSPLSFSS